MPSAARPRASSSSPGATAPRRWQPGRRRARPRSGIAPWCLLRSVGYDTRTGGAMKATLLAALLLSVLARPAVAAPEGTLTWGLHVTLASKWLDPSDTEAFINPFMVLYAIHDAVVKPMPGNDNTPSLAESWTMSRDGLTYEFVLRKGVKFHNGDPVTADDVKFSFDRYRGAAAKLLKDKVREVSVVAPGRVSFHLKEPWPDFMTFYGTSATGAAWIVPKKYV